MKEQDEKEPGCYEGKHVKYPVHYEGLNEREPGYYESLNEIWKWDIIEGRMRENL